MTTPLKPCCSIGAWLDHDAIDDDLRACRLGIRAIAAKYKISKGQVERHRTHLGVSGGLKNGSYLRLDEPEQEEEQVVQAVTTKSESVDVEEPAPEQTVSKTVQDSARDSETAARDGRTAERDSGWTNGVVAHETVKVEIVRVDEKADGDHARAPVLGDPKKLKSWVDRVEHIAFLIVEGQWYGKQTVRRLTGEWGYESYSTVWRMHREATTAINLHTPTLVEKRDETLARLERVEQLAIDSGELRVAAVAIVEGAKISGIYQNGTPPKRDADPGFAAFWQRMIQRLSDDGHHEAIAAMADEARKIDEEEREKGR